MTGAVRVRLTQDLQAGDYTIPAGSVVILSANVAIPLIEAGRAVVVAAEAERAVLDGQIERR